MRLQEQQLRKIIRETLLLEIPGFIIDPGQGGDGGEFSELFGGLPLGDWLASLGELWNRSAGKFIVKIPGLPGAENYEWSDAALDILLLAAGGGLVGVTLKAVNLTSKGAKAATAAKGLYHAVSNRVGNEAARKLVQVGMKSVGKSAITAPVGEAAKALKQYAESGEAIHLKISDEQFKQAIETAKNQGIQLVTTDSELEDLSLKANQAFGITV
jgi:hypothetical protein